MTDQKLATRLKEIQYEFDGDTEMIHWEMDQAILNALKELGFEESVKIFEGETKWYA